MDIIERQAQPYVGITASITMTTFGKIADRIPEIAGWMAANGVEIAGPPFLRYHLIDMERELVVEAGFPTTGRVDGEGEITPGVLPAGRYVTHTHHGHPDQLGDVIDEMHAWVAGRGLSWDMEQTPDGERWGCRLEVYHTHPGQEPDPNNWDTQLLFRLKDPARP
ncbi:GyrI-like domain-containing protein [Thermoactinospora rubra]|uniref:GyrI-like domain-containing protein n=1 Tax=Thermoactinospora rubra TaxID=1088767 RepID=UPI000A103AEA|nr:GyrI-like domain-containing protein [Thermoactinospora rubra]